MGEAIGGDIPAPRQSQETGKAEQERRDFLELTALLEASLRRHLLELWDEYESGGSPEAALVKGLDKLETLIQHNQGDKSEKLIDYAFNLEYGRQYMKGHPLLTELRNLIDPQTAANVELATGSQP